MKSGISWTDQTWNPIVGCSKVSIGCDHCWAERMVRLHYHKDFPEGWDDNVKLFPGRLDQPLHWRKPRRIAVGLMGDLFHDAVPFNFLTALFGRIGHARWHTFQILTKRPKRMFDFVSTFTTSGFPFDKLFPNVWLGVSCEDQKTADKRIAILLQTPAAVRFISCEPLLGPIDLQRWLPVRRASGFSEWVKDGLYCGLSWAIVGGESGPGARPMHPDWARSLRDQCQTAGIPFHFKQWGEWGPNGGEVRNTLTDIKTMGCDRMRLLHKKRAGRLLDGREWLEFPEAKG